MSLSHYQIKNLQPRERPYKLADSDGLYLTVNPSGSKLWRMNYRHLGVQKCAHFGQWPHVGLAEARERRDEAKRQIAQGRDPAHEKRAARLVAMVAATNTFMCVAEEWVAKTAREGRAPVTLSKIRWLLDKAYPLIGKIPVSELTAHQVLAALRTVENKGHYESAARMRSVIGRVLRYAIATGRAARDVSADLRGALVVPQVKHLAAITSEEGAGRLLRSIDDYHGSPVTRLAMLLSAHLFVRPGELRSAEWSEIDWKAAIWSIPAAKTKMRRAHRVPLSRQAQLLIVELHDLTGQWNWLFPSDMRPRNCMSENTVNTALRRMGYAEGEMTAHGFRAMAATLLNETGRWHPDAVERQLAHLEKSEVRRAYTRGQHWDERVRMMQFWSDYLDELRDRREDVGAEATVPNYMMLARENRVSRPAPPNWRQRLANARVRHAQKG